MFIKENQKFDKYLDLAGKQENVVECEGNRDNLFSLFDWDSSQSCELRLEK